MAGRIALQLYTLRSEMSSDFVGTLRRVAGLGYQGVEFAGYGGLTAGDMKRLLDELGLVAAGSHVGLARLEGALDDEIAYASAIGLRDIALPVMPEGRRETLNDFRRLADFLNATGERCRAGGLRLSYHNHAFEFARFDGAYALDRLLAWTDPAVVFWEPDVYWIARAGEDPVAYLRKYADRCPLVHIKDVADDAERSFAEVGAGTLDFEALFAAAPNADWYVVEQDRTKGPAIDSARISIENLRGWSKL
jgi:sugar phosphate isomerase/epimerase